MTTQTSAPRIIKASEHARHDRIPRDGMLLQNGVYYLVLEHDGVFTTQECPSIHFQSWRIGNKWVPMCTIQHTVPAHKNVYVNIHPDVTIDQVNHAKHHWDDGEYWHFSQHHQQDHQDHEIDILDAVAAFCKDEYRELLISAISTERGDNSAGPGDPVSNKTVALIKLQNFVDFERQVGECAVKEARLYHLGQIGGVHNVIRQCLEKGVFLAKFTQSEEYGTISTEVDKVVAKMKAVHTYETQAEQAARLRKEEAARKAKEAAESETESGS